MREEEINKYQFYNGYWKQHKEVNNLEYFLLSNDSKFSGLFACPSLTLICVYDDKKRDKKKKEIPHIYYSLTNWPFKAGAEAGAKK